MIRAVTAAAAAAASIVLAAACGAADDEPTQEPTVARGAASGAPTTAGSVPQSDDGAATIRVATPFGQLKLPRSSESALSLLTAMPSEIGTARRQPAEEGSATYVDVNGEFGLATSEVTDIYPGLTSAQTFERLRSTFRGKPTSCAAPPARCLAGLYQGEHAIILGHDSSGVVMIAHAPDERRRDAVLEAWAALGS